MTDRRTVQVVVNLSFDANGWTHWFVTTQEELETVTWEDDGTEQTSSEAITKAIKIARSELEHLTYGGRVSP